MYIQKTILSYLTLIGCLFISDMLPLLVLEINHNKEIEGFIDKNG